MKKSSIIFFLILFKSICAQVGIGKSNPSASLDIQSKSNSTSAKAIKATGLANNEVFTVFDNGNLQFEGALMPNGNPGEKGQYLFSKGSGYAPEWKNVFPEQSKQIYDVFQGVYLASTGTLNMPASTWNRVGPTTININNSSVGSWNASSREFTVSKSGIYIISFSLDMYTGSSAAGTQAFARLTAATNYDFFAAQLEEYYGSYSLYYSATAGEIVKKLNVGDKIYISGYAAYPWRQIESSLQIKYVEL